MKSLRKKQISLKGYIGNLSQAELEEELLTLIDRFPEIKQYYQVRLNTDQEQPILDVYKKRVKNEFFPERGFGHARLSIARKPIIEYKRIATNSINLVDLMLYYVEQGVKYTLEYGDIDEPFYNSMESMYYNALELIAKDDLCEHFNSRCQKILNDTSGIGWGFHDTLDDLYKEYYKNNANQPK